MLFRQTGNSREVTLRSASIGLNDGGALDSCDKRAFDYFTRQTLRAGRSPASASARATAAAGRPDQVIGGRVYIVQSELW